MSNREEVRRVLREKFGLELTPDRRRMKVLVVRKAT